VSIPTYRNRALWVEATVEDAAGTEMGYKVDNLIPKTCEQYITGPDLKGSFGVGCRQKQRQYAEFESISCF
jgi:hypothetical protein